MKATWENAEAGDTIGKEKIRHTPGPWKANLWANGWEVGAVDSHYTVCSLANYNNADANARLIAAAPDLLEACKRALVAIDQLPPRFNEDRFEPMNMLIAAIAKAERISATE